MTTTHAILSPHFDDAVLSCWHLLAGPDDVCVVNVFAGAPDEGASSGWWDAVAGEADARQAVGARIAEDRAALAVAGREAVNLGFLDQQYRDAPQPLEPLVEALRETVPREAIVWAPGALLPMPDHPLRPHGPHEAHPDHLAVRAAALELRAEGRPVAVYADLPHASAQGWPHWVAPGSADGRRVGEVWSAALAQAGLARDELTPEVVRLDDDQLDAKKRALGFYASQLATIERIFGRRLDDPELVGREVVWRLPPVA